jgi:16S rRNA (cytidine1402-2'-O)-methyltransferase
MTTMGADSPGAAPSAVIPGSTGRLWVVGTPIGNLGDLSPRAVATLDAVEIVCCEDTRRTRALLTATGVAGRGRLVSLHAHNEQSRVPQVLAHLAAGRDVALVTDAGMPGISDPGGRVVAAAVSAGHPVTVVPGPSAALAALVVSGLPTERFCMEGFLPRRGTDRRHRLEILAVEARTTVIFESPQRLAETLTDLVAACGGERPVAVARELTKLHEAVFRGTLADAASALAPPVRGEVVLVLGGAAPPPPVEEREVAARVRAELAAGASPRAAADVTARELGVSRRQAYGLAIAARDAAEGRA